MAHALPGVQALTVHSTNTNNDLAAPASPPQPATAHPMLGLPTACWDWPSMLSDDSNRGLGVLQAHAATP